MKGKHSVKRRMATAVFADVEGSTELAMEKPRAGIELLVSYKNMTEQSAEASGGTVVKWTGDGCLAVFATPAQAVEFAVKILERLRAFNAKRRPLRDISIRLGVATGELVEIGSDLFGTTVNLAARLSQLATPGEILCDEPTDGFRIKSRRVQSVLRGERILRGFPRKFRIYSLSRKKQ